MKSITLRVSDELAEDVNAIAAARGTTVSELVRSALEALVDPDEPVGERDVTEPEVPTSMTTIERHQTALLHRILARLVEGNDDDGDRAHQLHLASILERGYSSHYGDVFAGLEVELPARDAHFVMDVLDMFTQLEWSVSKLTDEERKVLGERASWAEFEGFDLNDRREARLLGFARHLIAQGKWRRLADRFEADRDYGNSHASVADMYARMLEVHRPIWTERLRGFERGDYALELDDIKKITDAAVHSSNRQAQMSRSGDGSKGTNDSVANTKRVKGKDARAGE